MWDVLKAFFAVVIALGVLLGIVTGLYWLCGLLPQRWRESWRAWVFLFPAMLATLIGLLIPVFRTLYMSFYDDTAKKFIGFDNYTEIFTTAGTRLAVINSVVWVVVGTLTTVTIGLSVARFADGMGGERPAK